MTSRDICDLAYVLITERLERRVLSDRQALLSRGVVENLPTPGVEQALFDAWLHDVPQEQAELSPADAEKLDELRALGVR